MGAAIGIMIEGQEGLNWRRWRKLCEDVEALGFDSLWRSDHLFSVMGVEGRDCIECWTSLGLCAEWTKRIQFGPLVSPMTFRHPGLLARIAHTVDGLSPGRLVLGIGAGWYEKEHQLHGIPFPSLKERMDNLEAAARHIRKTWSGPLQFGGAGEKRLLKFVALYGDEWNTYGLSPDDYAAKVKVLEAHCEDAGRDPKTVRQSMMVNYLIGESESDLHMRARAIGDVIPRFKEMTPAEVVTTMRMRGVAGTPDEIVAALQPYVNRGVTRFNLQHFLMDDTDALKLLAQKVIPALV